MSASHPIMLGCIIWHYWLIGAKGNGKEEVQEIWALVKLITFERKKNHLSQWGHYAYTGWQDRQIPFLFFLLRHTANPYSDLIADGSEESSCYQGNCDGWFWLFSDTSGKRNPQLKNCLYQTGLQPCWGWGIFLIGVGGHSPLGTVPSLGRWPGLWKKGGWVSFEASQ